MLASPQSGGTRGDVQPACALGVAFSGLGAAVRLAADRAFQQLIEDQGLEFFPLGGDARQMMALTVKGMLPTEFSGMFWLRQQIQETMESVWAAATVPRPAAGEDLLQLATATAVAPKGLEDATQQFQTKAPLQQVQHTGVASEADAGAFDGPSSDAGGHITTSPLYKPDLIVANQLAYGQVHVAERLGVPLHIILTIPWRPTTSFAHPWARAFGHNIVDYFNGVAWALLEPALHLAGLASPGPEGLGARLRAIMLPGIANFANWVTTPLLDHTAWYPTTCLFSPALVPKPSDWGSDITVAGFVSLPDAVERVEYMQHRQTCSSSVMISPIVDNLVDAANSKDQAVQQMAIHCNNSRQNSGICFQPPQDLLDFLDAGEAPIYVGFGSMVVGDTERLLQLAGLVGLEAQQDTWPTAVEANLQAAEVANNLQCHSCGRAALMALELLLVAAILDRYQRAKTGWSCSSLEKLLTSGFSQGK
eukprot:gene2108-2427_t